MSRTQRILWPLGGGLAGAVFLTALYFAIVSWAESPQHAVEFFLEERWIAIFVLVLGAAVIPPGKVSIVTLTLDAGFHDVAGRTVRRGVIIESNDPNRPETELWTQAAVRNP